MYVIIQQNIIGGHVAGVYVIEICTSFREMVKTMERIREGCHKLGYKGEFFEDNPYTGRTMSSRFTTPTGAQYRFDAYEREKNVKWGNFPY